MSPDNYLNELLIKVQRKNINAKKKVSIKKVQKAIYYAKKYHADQKRDSGEPFYTHPLSVAIMVADYIFDTNIIITSILHDIIEDTNCTLDIIKAEFGELIASNVEKLTRIKAEGKISAKDILYILYIQQDMDLLIVKLLDRLHNLKTINFKSTQKQKKIKRETLEAFIPIANLISEFQLAQDLSILSRGV
jgi:guanosine-3',5'-bis(diphosphate) 3'-pyrophosphohydrolase